MAIKKEIQDTTLTISFEDGTEGNYDVSSLSNEIKQALLMHGLSQKLGDSYAGDRENAKEIVTALWNELTQGNWSTRGEGGARVTQLARAVAQVYQVEVEAAVERLAELSKEETKALAASKTINAALQQIKAKDAAEKAAKAAAAAQEADEEVAPPSLF